MTQRDLTAFQAQIGYVFADSSLLERALTHRSFNRRDNYEAYEYLGDAFLLSAVREWLILHVEDARLRLKICTVAVCNEMLGIASRRLGIPALLRMSREEACGDLYHQSKKYADVYEALVTAIYHDGGYTAARDFIWRTLPLQKLADGYWRNIPTNPSWKDAQHELDKLMVTLECPPPVYTYVENVGCFQVWCVETPYGMAHGRGMLRTEGNIGADHAKGNATSKLLRKLMIDLIPKDLYDDTDPVSE